MVRTCSIAAIGMFALPCAGQDRPPEHLLRLSRGSVQATWYRVREEVGIDACWNGARRSHRLRMDMYWKRIVERTDEDALVAVDSLARLRAAGRDTDEKGANTYTFDSAGDAATPVQVEALTGFLDAPVERIVDARGWVRGLRLPQYLQGMETMPYVRLIRTSHLIVPAELELPELPVAVGASWPGKTDTSVAGSDKLTVHSVYTLQSVVKGQAQIKQLLTVTPVRATKKERAGVGQAEAEAASSLGRRTQRTFTLDLGSGRIVGVEEETVVEDASVHPHIDMRFTIHRHRFPIDKPPGELAPMALPETEAETSATSPPATDHKGR